MAGDITQPKRALDEALLNEAGKNLSPAKIAKNLNNAVSAEYVQQRLVELLEQDDWLTQKQKEQLAMRDIYRVKDILMKNLEANPSELGGHINRTLKLLTDQLERVGRANEDKMLLVQAKHATVMYAGLQAIGAAMEQKIKERFPEISEDELSEIFREAVPLGIAAVEDRVDQ